MKPPKTIQETMVHRWRENHHRALETLRAPNCKLTGLQLWRRLGTIERMTHDAALKYCNGEMQSDDFDEVKEYAHQRIEEIFGHKVKGFFVNSDPRGYALKLDNEKTTIPEGMHKDWGGYGILAAMIE